ncbi:MAG: glycosyltransferase [Pyrinomonadaceae bacterium]
MKPSVIRVGIFDQIVSGGGVRLFTTKLLEAFSQLAGSKWHFHLMWPLFDSSNNFLPRPNLPNTSFERINVSEFSTIHNCVIPVLERISPSENLYKKIDSRVFLRIKAYVNETRKKEQQDLRSAGGLGLQWLDQRMGRFDLIYLPYPYLTLPREIEWHPSKPLVITLHDLAHEQTDAWGEMTKPLRHEVSRWTGISDLVIFSSDFIKNEAQQLYDLPDERARRIYLAHPESKNSHVTSIDVLARYNLSKGYIFSLGWAAKHKRVETILEGFALFKERSKMNLSLVIAGPLTENLFNRSAYGLEVGRDVFALGYVKDEEVTSLYQHSSVVVTASISEAGLNAVIFDAMHHGKAIICSNIPQFVERVGTDDSVALIFDPYSPQSLADAFSKHFSDPEQARIRVSKAKQFISFRNVSDVGQEYLDAFESVLLRRVNKRV